MRHLVARSVLAASATFTSVASADFPADCPGLGNALVSHSCFHARYGPYRTVNAVTATELASAPRVDGVHTQYEVVLANPLAQSLVTYQVASASRRGAWAFFHSDTVPLVVETMTGARLAPVHTQRISSCAFLPKVDVYELGTERVRLVFGPANVTRTVLVAENVDDFVIENGRDGDGDGYGTMADRIPSFCVPPPGYVQNADDCNDGDARIHPAALETCDGVDQNCNGVADDVGLPCAAGLGACARDGVGVCDAVGAIARCSAAPGPAIAETCDGKDTNCDGKDDLDTAALCSDAVAPRCMVDEGIVRCGCATDSDCGNATSGRICDLGINRCVEGCVDLPSRNGCPTGARCSSTDPRVPGKCAVPCVPDCTIGATCREGACVPNEPPLDAGVPSVDSSMPVPAQPAPPGDDAGGCACTVGRETASSFGASSALLILGLLALRRKRSS